MNDLTWKVFYEHNKYKSSFGTAFSYKGCYKNICIFIIHDRGNIYYLRPKVKGFNITIHPNCNTAKEAAVKVFAEVKPEIDTVLGKLEESNKQLIDLISFE